MRMCTGANARILDSGSLNGKEGEISRQDLSGMQAYSGSITQLMLRKGPLWAPNIGSDGSRHRGRAHGQ
jgi:hypothetical protein